MTVYENARAFVYRNARPLDRARFAYHFKGGSRGDVMTVLSAYQNADGGFGHALEPDAWNPDSTPIQTWAATETLHEIGFEDACHPVVQGILRYLQSGQDFDGHTWANAPESNNAHPHASWWHSQSTSTSHHSYNPTACLAGFILKFAAIDSAVYALGLRVAQEAVDAYLAEGLLNDTHTAACYVRLWEYATQARAAIGGDAGTHTPLGDPAGAGIDLPRLEARLREQVTHSITHDTAQWDTGYICRPSHFFRDRDSVFYAGNEEIAAYECDFILRTQLPDGSWPIPWAWAAYPEEWAISKNWWKGHAAVNNLLYLKGMGRLG